MLQMPIPKESLTVTHLRKLHRQGASRTAMNHVAGGEGHFKHLDSRYGITCPPQPEEDKPISDTRTSAASVSGGGSGRPLGATVPAVNDNDIPPRVYVIARAVALTYGLGEGVLFGPRSNPWLREPRAMFVGVVEDHMPHVTRAEIAHVCNRDTRMVSVYAANHSQFFGSPEYTLRFESVLAALEAK